MFPNKLRCESFDNRPEFCGERKIVTLIKEKIIFESKDLTEYEEHYK